MGHIIAPSILASNFLRLGDEIQMLNESKADWIHIDVMDGHFVPNLSFGLPVFKDIRVLTEKVLDVHLMVENPIDYIEDYAKAGVTNFTVHAEVCPHLHRVVQAIHTSGMKAGVALNPHTPISCLEYIINDVELVCVMSVNPGFGGQQFIETTYDKTRELKQLITEKNANTIIEIDGGVSIDNAKQLIDLGADVLVAGSAVFKAMNPIDMIAQLHAV